MRERRGTDNRTQQLNGLCGIDRNHVPAVRKRGRMLLAVLAGLLCCLFAGKTAEAGEQLYFDEQGNLRMTTYDRIATNSITYKTVGWTIKRYDMPIGAPGNDCVAIMLEDNGVPSVDPQNPAYQNCYFWCDKQTIFNRIGSVSLEWQSDLYRNGGTLYLDAIMTVCHSGTPSGGLTDAGAGSWGTVHDTFEGIADAQPWSDREALRSHFNKQVFFAGNPALLNPECTYQIKNYECFSDSTNMWPLSRYQRDREGKLEAGQELAVLPEDLNAYEFTYISAFVERFYQDGSAERMWVDELPVRVSNDGHGLQAVSIGLYYRRRENISYLTDIYNMDNGTVQLEGAAGIYAGTKEEQTFDVACGVPTGEMLYVQGQQNALAYEVKYKKHAGWKTMPVVVASIYQCQWTDADGTVCSEQLAGGEVYYTDRQYSYWEIESIEVYTLESVALYNYAFRDQAVTVEGIYAPEIVIRQGSAYIKKESEAVPLYWVDGGTLYGDGRKPDFPYGIRQPEANDLAGRFLVANDTFSVDDEVFLGGNEVQSCAGDPKLGSNTGPAQFYLDQIPVPKEKRNGRDYKSRAVVRYRRYGDDMVSEQDFSPVNPVTLHTPVLCQGYVTDEKEYNQYVHPDPNRKSWILGRTFRVQISSYGVHLEQPGYGEQEYGNYVDHYEISFPFEVYAGEEYYEAGSVIRYQCGTEGMEFYLPTGVKEGNYTVEVRSVAYNYHPIFAERMEEAGNYEVENYIAYDRIDIAVCGRLYGMRIVDIERDVWQNVFRNGQGVLTGNSYTVGLHNLNGKPIRTNPLATLPILAGGHPYMADEEGEPLGTAFRFRVESIGDYGEDDGIYIRPEYYVMDPMGKRRRSVDIYQFVSEDGKEHWRPVQSQAECMVQHLGTESRRNIGTNVRNVKDENAALASVQLWEGRFVLPDEVYVVSAGTDLEQYLSQKGSIGITDPIFIQKGYLMVQFQIYTVKDKQAHLDYINIRNEADGYANMWRIEGFANPKKKLDGTEFALSYGDVFLYDLEKHAQDSHVIMGTH